MATQCPFKDHPLREGLETPPRAMQELLHDKRGYPVPYFVEWLNTGEPEFRAMDGRKLIACVRDKLCWVCGKKLFGEMVFCVGPMCCVNGINSEPPSHRQCAQYSARNCPFLSMPKMVRRGNDLPEEIRDPAGISIKRNPGVACLWFTKSYKVVRVPQQGAGNAGILFEMGRPFLVEWYAEGRQATRAEVLESIDSGMPLLQAANDQETTAERKEEGRKMLAERYERVMKMIPKASR